MKVYPIGTKGKAACDLTGSSCKIKKGEEVTIIYIDDFYPLRGYTLMTNDGRKIIHTGFESIIPFELD